MAYLIRLAVTMLSRAVSVSGFHLIKFSSIRYKCPLLCFSLSDKGNSNDGGVGREIRSKMWGLQFGIFALDGVKWVAMFRYLQYVLRSRRLSSVEDLPGHAGGPTPQSNQHTVSHCYTSSSATSSSPLPTYSLTSYCGIGRGDIHDWSSWWWW